MERQKLPCTCLCVLLSWVYLWVESKEGSSTIIHFFMAIVCQLRQTLLLSFYEVNVCHRAAERLLLCQRTGLNKRSWVYVIYCSQWGPIAKTRKENVKRGKGINIKGDQERGREERSGEERREETSFKPSSINRPCVLLNWFWGKSIKHSASALY